MSVGLVDEARAAIRESPAGSEHWRTIYASALLRARRERDDGSLVGLGTLAAARLLSEGRDAEALSQLDFALAAARMPDETAHVLAVRSSAFMYAGRVDAAYAALEEAAERPDLDIPALTELEVYRGVLDCVAMRPVDLPALARLALRVDVTGHENWCSGLLRWVIAALIAAGRAGDAQPWIEFLRVAAEAARHPWRMADAFVLRAAADPWVEPEGAHERTSILAAEHHVNLATLGLYRALHAEQGPAPETYVARIEARAPTLPSSQRETIAGFGMLTRALRGADVPALPPPARPTLLNLPGALAAAEAIAHRGPTAGVAPWAAWLATVPRQVVTAMGWPVPVALVRGMLALRLARGARGHVELRSARRLCERQGHPCLRCSDQALAWASIGRARASAADLEAAEAPGLHLQGAIRLAGRRLPAGEQLTRKELEMLNLLGAGHTYRTAGVAAGVSWRTVQAHARNSYRKLGVHSRADALAVARQRGFL